MATYYKVAVCVDKEDYGAISQSIEKICETGRYDRLIEKKTPDCTYVCVYWDYINWPFAQGSYELEEAIQHIRHAFVKVNLDSGVIGTDVDPEDERGYDEEFYEMLGFKTDITFWDPEYVLTAEKDECPVPKEKILRVLRDYVAFDLEATETWYIYDMLGRCGCSDEEIKDLGFEWCLPVD